MGKQTHGMAKTNFYAIWHSMKARCLNHNNNIYIYYGGRGISVCDEWLDFQGFMDDMYQSYQQHIKDNDYTSIDRIDNDGNYELSNCKWATRKEQANNCRTNKIIFYKGQKMTLKQWSEKLNLNYDVLKWRLLHNWTVERTFKN